MGASGVSALEVTAVGDHTAEITNAEIRLTASNNLIAAAISEVNKKVLAIEKCMNKDMLYKPADAVADADGCVGVTMSTETKTVTLPNVRFDTYTDTSSNSKGWFGNSIRTIDLSSFVAEGAKAIEVRANKTQFAGGCDGPVLMNVAKVDASYDQSIDCHYDGNPNRHHYLEWSYNPASRSLTVVSRASQTKYSLPTGAMLTGITGAYEVVKLVVGSGD
jgi:hypothetical protein